MRLTCLPFKTSFPPFLHFRASKCPTNMPSKHICRIRRVRIIYFRLFQVSFKSKLVLSRIQLFKIYPERKKLRRATFFYLWMINFAFDRISWNRYSLFQYWPHIDSMADSLLSGLHLSGWDQRTKTEEFGAKKCYKSWTALDQDKISDRFDPVGTRTCWNMDLYSQG